jgi:acetoacetyl-CoA synthetase
VSETPRELWRPSPERVAATTLTRFMKGTGAEDYDALWRWSVEDLEGFWAKVWDFCEIRAHAPYERVLASREMPGATWFPGAELNYAEHVLAAGEPDDVAILHAREGHDLGSLTRAELGDVVARIATGLRKLGVGRGDRVVAFTANVPEAIAAMLATASLGALWSSASPDFGSRAVLDRFEQIEPKVLIAVDGYRYGGKDFDRRDVVTALRDALPSLEATVLLPNVDEDAKLEGAMPWRELVAEQEPLEFAAVPFDHPLWVLYSSGTTGKPKGIVHGHGGMLLEHAKLGRLHVDLQRGDRMFWFTTTGWMMWNFLVGCLLTDAAVVLYDGNPGHPDLGVLWDLAADAGVTHFGTSAAYLTSCMKGGVEPRSGRDLSALRGVGSTGSPLGPEGFAWTYDQLGPDLWLFSMSGGTDMCTAFVGGAPILPVYEGELQCRALGAKVEAWDPEGRPVEDEVGELVITEPMPCMPLGLWNDESGERYRESYFDMYPGVWRHGDWIRITPRGTAVITGRSDSTINRGGIRMGTSEIYSAVFELDEIQDALVVDVDGWMPLFVVLAEDAELDDDLKKGIATRIREDCSPRHVPNEVFAVEEIPRTRTGKVLEVPVKKILAGAPPDKAASRDAVQNPDALDWFIAFAAERTG